VLRLRITATTPGSSLGYRLDGGDWRLYSEAFPDSPGTQIEAKAVRYGWAENRPVRALAEDTQPSP